MHAVRKRFGRNLERSLFKTNQRENRDHSHPPAKNELGLVAPVVSAAQETGVGGSPEPGVGGCSDSRKDSLGWGEDWTQALSVPLQGLQPTCSPSEWPVRLPKPQNLCFPSPYGSVPSASRRPHALRGRIVPVSAT